MPKIKFIEIQELKNKKKIKKRFIKLDLNVKS